jgi:transposase
MITLELTEKQLDELYDGMSSNDTLSGRKRCLIVYLRAKGYPRDVVADIARADPDTVTNHVKRYADGGLQGLLKDNYRSPKSQLEAHAGELKELFEKKHRTRSTKR